MLHLLGQVNITCLLTDLKKAMILPIVAIIIVTWNGLEDTIECLESLKNVTYPDYNVIVVDNGSQDNDAGVLKERFGSYIHLIENARNDGFTGGVNVGMKYARDNSQADYILLLNNDTVVAPGFLTEMVKVADSDPTIGVTGAKIYCYDEPEQLQSVYCRVNLLTGQPIQTPLTIDGNIIYKEIDRGQYNSIKEVEWVTGCCFLIKRVVMESIGLLDEGFFYYWEETDYCFRARKAGYKTVYVPQAKVWHKGGRSVKKVWGRSRYYMERNRFIFMKRHATAWQYRLFLIYFFGIHIWLATGYFLIICHSLELVSNFYRGVRDGLFIHPNGA